MCCCQIVPPQRTAALGISMSCGGYGVYYSALTRNRLMHDLAKTKLEMKPVRKRISIAISGVVGLACLLIVIKGLQFFTMYSAGKKMAPPLETVTSAIVEEEDWAPMLSAVGSISPVQGAMISSELPGVVAEVGFESG